MEGVMEPEPEVVQKHHVRQTSAPCTAGYLAIIGDIAGGWPWIMFSGSQMSNHQNRGARIRS